MAAGKRTSRAQHEDKLIRYISDPDNPFPSRGEMVKICGITEPTFYVHFTPDDLAEIEIKGLDARRKRYARFSVPVDQGLIKKASEGDPAACKLFYQKMEGWSEKSTHALTGADGKGPVKIEESISFPEIDQKIEELRAGVK